MSKSLEIKSNYWTTINTIYLFEEKEIKNFNYSLKLKNNKVSIYPKNENIFTTVVLDNNEPMFISIGEEPSLKLPIHECWKPNYITFIELELKSWKNLSFPLRQWKKDFYANIFSLIVSSPIHEEFKTDTKTDEVLKFPDMDKKKQSDKMFCFSAVSHKQMKIPSLYVGSQKYNNVKDWIQKLTKLNDRVYSLDLGKTLYSENLKLADYCEYSNFWHAEFLNDKKERYVLFKPNGYLWINRFFEMLNVPYQIISVTLLNTAENHDYIKYFYPFCHNRPYGQEWYHYLMERPLIFVKFECDSSMTLNKLNAIKIKIREESNFIWTKNIIHAPENNLEEQHMKIFEERIRLNLHIFDDKWEERIQDIESLFKEDSIQEYLSFTPSKKNLIVKKI